MDPGYENRPGNYLESSGTGMFIYGLLKALRLGYLEGDKYRCAALEAWTLMKDTFATRSETDNILNLDWTVQTGSLSSNGTYEYYISMPLFQNDLKGVAPFLFSSYEAELLNQ
ncbi:cell wall glycosyl hydrolase [Phlyctema vagabunda]|uniref:Cell wall glycosyl hydrolase n=1 Tax=Phlyctema vagabunda TaxID=108571 RepID=A0ABR4PV68_9HELO